MKRDRAQWVVLAASIALPLLLAGTEFAHLIRAGGVIGLYMVLALGLNFTMGYVGLFDLGFIAFYAVGAYGAALCARHGWRGRLNPATRVFMALRMAVNRELDVLRSGLESVKPHVAPGGRVAVISFHSGEDRIVKETFRAWSAAGAWRLVNKKPLCPTSEEVLANPRARSAKLRAIERSAA